MEAGRVTVTPRRPDFDFEGLEHEVPRACIAGLWIAVVLLALALPSVCYRILASAGAAHDLHAWRLLGVVVDN